jgi:hypothetical protein
MSSKKARRKKASQDKMSLLEKLDTRKFWDSYVRYKYSQKALQDLRKIEDPELHVRDAIFLRRDFYPVIAYDPDILSDFMSWCVETDLSLQGRIFEVKVPQYKARKCTLCCLEATKPLTKESKCAHRPCGLMGCRLFAAHFTAKDPHSSFIVSVNKALMKVSSEVRKHIRPIVYGIPIMNTLRYVEKEQLILEFLLGGEVKCRDGEFKRMQKTICENPWHPRLDELFGFIDQKLVASFLNGASDKVLNKWNDKIGALSIILRDARSRIIPVELPKARQIQLSSYI